MSSTTGDADAAARRRFSNYAPESSDTINNMTPTDPIDRDGVPIIDPYRNLTKWDVAALIVNKMIGTGIFTSPYIVLKNSPSKTVAIVLWVVGFIYTFLSMIMYFEFARKLPFTGGELVYLDDILPKFPLWASTLYAFYFVAVYATTTNAMQFGAQVLLASNSKAKLEELDQRNLRFLAVVVTTAICLLLYLSSAKSRSLNRITAFTKFLLLIVLCCFGIAYLCRPGNSHLGDWNEGPPKDDNTNKDDKDNEGNKPKWHIAVVMILYSFHGWENATLVAGEIPSFSVLRKGTILALTVIGTLYLAIATIVALAFSWGSEKEKLDGLKSFPAVFLNVTRKADDAPEDYSNGIHFHVSIATAVLISFSAIGSMVSVTYTSVRVKQAIGWTNILPLSWIWRRSGPLRPEYQRIPTSPNHDGRFDLRLALADDSPYSYVGTPEGGIILHWIVTIFYICITATITSVETAISFSANLVIYGHFLVQAVLASGFSVFDPVDPRTRPVNYPTPGWLPADGTSDRAWWMKWEHPETFLGRLTDGPLQILLAGVVGAFSIALLAMDSIDPPRVQLTITMSLLALACIYWFLCIWERSAKRVHGWFGYDLKLLRHGSDSHYDPERICSFCERFEAIELSMRRDQSNSDSVALHEQGTASGHRHTHYGYLMYVSRNKKRGRRAP